MKVDAVFKFTSTFDLYIPVVDGQAVNWVSIGEGIKCFLVPVSGGTVNLLTHEQLDVGSQVRNVVDRAGNEVFAIQDLSYPMYVHSASPQMSPFGIIIGWSHTLRRTLPRDVAGSLDDFISANS